MSTIVNSTTDMIWSVDSEHFGLLAFNHSLRDNFLKQRGISIRIGMRPEELFPTENFIKLWHELYHRVLSEGPYTTEYLTHSSSAILQLTFNLLKRDGKVFGISVFGKDITERKQAEEALRDSEERFKLSMEATRDGLWDWNLKTDGGYFSPGYYRMLGYEQSDFCVEGKAWMELIHPDDRERALGMNMACIEGRCETFEVEYRMKAKSGEWRWILGRGKCIARDEQGRALRLVGTHVDITERKLAEEAIRKSEDKFSKAFKATPEAVTIALMEDGRYIEVNDVFLEVTGFQRDEVINHTSIELNFWVSADKRQQYIDKLISAGSLRNFDVQFRMRSGEIRDFLVSSEIIELEGNKCSLNFILDITERKRAEEALRESETRFRELFSHMSSGVAIYEAVDDGSDFIIRDFNEAGQKMEKTGKEDAVGRRVTEVFPGVKEMGILDVFRRVWKSGNPEYFPTSFYKDGRISGWRENQVYKLPSGEIVAVYDDVTERQVVQEKLQEERNLLRTLIDHIPDRVYVKDKSSRFVVSNKTLNEYWLIQGVNNIIDKTDFDLFEPPNAQKFFDQEQNVMRTGQSVINQDGYCTDKTGKRSYLLITKVPLRDIHGSVIGLLGIHRDITERKLTEDKLEQERNLLRTLIDHMPDGVYIKDKEGRLLGYNKSLAETWEARGRDDVIGKTDFDLFEPEVAQHYFDEEHKIMQTGQSIINKEAKCTDISGNPNYLLVTKVPLRDSAGNVTGLVGIHRDITKLKLADITLRQSEAILKESQHVAQLGHYVLDAVSGKFTCSEALEEVFGIDTAYPKTIEGWLNLLHPEQKDEMHDYLMVHVLKDRQLFDKDYCIIRQNDRAVRWVHGMGKLELNASGQPIRMFGTIQDITERKQTEQKILDYQKRLKQLASKLTLIEEQERRRIATELHDEVSQTLAMAKIKLDTLRNSPQAESSAAALDEINSYIKKVIQETRTLTFELSNPILYELGFGIAVAEWLEENVQKKHGIAAEFYDDGLPKPLNDDLKAMLFRNVRELLTNCIKHAKAGKIIVGIRRIDDSIEITVEDNGTGFDPAQIWAKTGKKATFGLFSIRESMENTGGSFQIQSKPGAGCKAIMIAPLKDQSDRKEV